MISNLKRYLDYGALKNSLQLSVTQEFFGFFPLLFHGFHPSLSYTCPQLYSGLFLLPQIPRWNSSHHQLDIIDLLSSSKEEWFEKHSYLLVERQ